MLTVIHKHKIRIIRNFYTLGYFYFGKYISPAYKAVAYSICLGYCVSVFTVYYANEATANDNKTTIITAGCVLVVVVVSDVVVLLFRIRHKKESLNLVKSMNHSILNQLIPFQEDCQFHLLKKTHLQLTSKRKNSLIKCDFFIVKNDRVF